MLKNVQVYFDAEKCWNLKLKSCWKFLFCSSVKLTYSEFPSLCLIFPIILLGEHAWTGELRSCVTGPPHWSGGQTGCGHGCLTSWIAGRACQDHGTRSLQKLKTLFNYSQTFVHYFVQFYDVRNSLNFDCNEV